MGLGIFEGIRNLEYARNRTCSLTDFLKSRSLLLDSGLRDHVRIHDVVRDVCIYLAKEKGYIGKDGCTWISSSQLVGERNELLIESRFPNLRLLSLSFANDYKFGSAFLERIKDLYVLCINYCWGLTSLPHTTQSHINLKTLLLHSCYELESISVVGKLRNLEILICRHCHRIEELPPEMKALNRLKLLELSTCVMLQRIGRGIISSLVRLEELKMFQSFNRWEADDRDERENAGLRELKALTNLRCLEIEIDDPALAAENMHLSSKLETFDITIGSYFSYTPVAVHREKMFLQLKEESCLADWIKIKLLSDTESLCLSGDGAHNVDLGKCQNIHSLELKDCKTMKSIIRRSILVDDAIENLVLRSLPVLEEIWDGPISSKSFQKLKRLQVGNTGLKQFWKSSSQNNYVPHFSNLSSIELYECHRLQNLGQLSIAGKDCLPQLEEIAIRKCEMMEQVFLWNNEGAGGNHQVITKVFPKVKEVELRYLPNLTTFYQGIESIKFPLLREMKIEECPKMKGIIIASNENNLGEITSNSEDDINDDHCWHLFCQSEKVSFGSLEVLEINHYPFCGHDEISSSLFNGLEELTINKYVGSMSVFTLSVAANLVSLRKLCIANGDEMITVIEDEQQQERILLFPKLEILQLENLPKLVSFCDWKCEVELPLLRKVEIKSCPNMENFSLGLVATPNLEAFITDLTTYVGVGVDVSFDSLKTVAIKWNENPLYHHKISVSLFNRLEELEFFEYKGGMSLLSSSAIRNLVGLRVLKLNKCYEIVKVIEDEKEEDHHVKVVSGGEIVFPKLEKLRLYRLPKLVSFCEWKCDVEFPSLRAVRIKWCDNIENLSLGSVAAPNLEMIIINGEYIHDAKELKGAMQQYLARK